MSTGKKPDNNPAQIKGDINRGLTGDKRPGFDPAAAPLETDGEAGGAPMSDQQVGLARETQKRAGRPPKAGSYGGAMRRFDRDADGGRFNGAAWIAAIAALALTGAVAALILLT